MDEGAYFRFLSETRWRGLRADIFDEAKSKDVRKQATRERKKEK